MNKKTRCRDCVYMSLEDLNPCTNTLGKPDFIGICSLEGEAYVDYMWTCWSFQLKRIDNNELKEEAENE